MVTIIENIWTTEPDEGSNVNFSDIGYEIFSHNDLAYEFYSNVENKVYSVDFSQDLRKQYPNKTEYTHTDIPRIREGKLSGQVRNLY